MLNRLLFPWTDLGVALQVAVLGVLVFGTWRLSRAHRHWRPMILGIGLLLLGLMGLRAAH